MKPFDLNYLSLLNHLCSATIGLKFGGNCFVFRKFRLKNAQWFLK